MSEIEEWEKKISKLGHIYDNKVLEFENKIRIMNLEHETLRFLIDMLTRKGVQEIQSATTFENLETRVSPIVDALFFVVRGVKGPILVPFESGQITAVLRHIGRVAHHLMPHAVGSRCIPPTNLL